MRYIYDQLIGDRQTTMEYYGREYELQQINRKGKFEYYTFLGRDGEKLLVVPSFLEEFMEVCKIFDRIKEEKSPEKVMQFLKRYFCKDIEREDVGEDTILPFHYKDIACSIELRAGVSGLYPEFTICSGNVVGNQIRVPLDEHPEFDPYYHDRFPDL